MFCGKCGSPVKDGNSFCSICGAPIDVPVTMINGSAQSPGQPIFQPVQTVPVYISTPQAGMPIQKNNFATAGLALGIVALSCFWVPLMSYGMGEDSETIIGVSSMFIIMSLLGILFSVLGIVKKRNGAGKGKAIAGLIVSGISVFFNIMAISIVFSV